MYTHIFTCFFIIFYGLFMQYNIISTDSHTNARIGLLESGHGNIMTPIFMPVATRGTIRGVGYDDIVSSIKAPIILSNTYHLFLRPGLEQIKMSGGLHKFMGMPHINILTDSGGFQLFSLRKYCSIQDHGVHIKDPLNGSKYFVTPSNIIHAQRVIGSDIMMVLDDCPAYGSSIEREQESIDRTTRWAEESIKYFHDSSPYYTHHQAIFGIVQGGMTVSGRRLSARQIVNLPFDGFAIGGLSVGEPTSLMYQLIEQTVTFLPRNKPRYLMGVGTPANLLIAISNGIDMFDCVMPTRNGRNGMLFTRNGIINLRNSCWKASNCSADEGFDSELCQRYTLAYLHHLFRCKEMLGPILASVHNLCFYLWLMNEAREHIKNNTFLSWMNQSIGKLEHRLYQ